MTTIRRSGWQISSFLLLSLLLLSPCLFSSYLSYNGTSIHFGNTSYLDVFSCTPASCGPGFVNLTNPDVLLTAARPLNDSFVEFLAARPANQSESCVIRLVASSPILVDESSPQNAVRFYDEDFAFVITQTPTPGQESYHGKNF